MITFSDIGGRVPRVRARQATYRGEWTRGERNAWFRETVDGWKADVWEVRHGQGGRYRFWTFQVVDPRDVTVVEPVAQRKTDVVAKVAAWRKLQMLRAEARREVVG